MSIAVVYPESYGKVIAGGLGTYNKSVFLNVSNSTFIGVKRQDLSNSVSMSNNGVLWKQDYSDSFEYFDGDYVGTSTTSTN